VGAGAEQRVGEEGLLDGVGGVHGVGGAGEDAEAWVALAAGADDLAVVALGQGFDEGVVAGEGAAHRVGVLLPEAGGADDVGEEERDGARGERTGRHQCWYLE